MKKIYISADVEGLNGVTNVNQIIPQPYNVQYEDMRIQLHKELNALIEGLKLGGAKEIVLNDAHNTMDNILLSEIPPDIKLISGKPKPVSMMYGLNSSFDGVVLFGYHAKAGSKGTLAHTFNLDFKSVKINDVSVSEAQLNSIYSGLLDVPTILISGDNVFCEEFKTDIGKTYCVNTKKVISFSAAENKINDKLIEEYKQTARKAIEDPLEVTYNVNQPYELKVELASSETAKKIANMLNINADNNVLTFKSSDYVECYLSLQAVSGKLTELSRN